MADPVLPEAPTEPYEKHRAQLKAVLLAWGMPEDNAETTADILSWADLHGVDSHGISMIPGYDRLRRQGRRSIRAGAPVDQRFHVTLVSGARAHPAVPAGAPVVHAPAATSDRATLGIEDRFEMRPAIGRERRDCELHGLA